MPTLLEVQHNPTPAVLDRVGAALRGRCHPESASISVGVHPALSTGPAHVLEVDGIILGTLASIDCLSRTLRQPRASTGGAT